MRISARLRALGLARDKMRRPVMTPASVMSAKKVSALLAAAWMRTSMSSMQAILLAAGCAVCGAFCLAGRNRKLTLLHKKQILVALRKMVWGKWWPKPMRDQW